ncbi:MAG TPA: FAD-dependent monooxygenase [Acidimicrobiales bacterium]
MTDARHDPHRGDGGQRDSEHEHDNREHEVVVVGARCAGAATAMLLARQGHDVLLVDRARFPSDTLSTMRSPAAAWSSWPAGTCSTGSTGRGHRRSGASRSSSAPAAR